MSLPDPHYADATNTLYVGDCLDVLAGMDDASVDAVVTDPPYELEFMGQPWDGSGVAFRADTWRQALRVLKPGGHLLAFGGSRTYHRLACAVEDAGFEVRDQLQWLYGSGFPKSLDVGKAIDAAVGAEREVIGSNPNGGRIGSSKYGQVVTDGSEVCVTAPATAEAQRWDGWGTALKPAHEPIVLARRPLAGTVAGNVLEHGTGALDVDGCRTPTTDGQPAWSYPNGAGGHAFKFNGVPNKHGAKEGPSGRWPANVVLGCACHEPHERGCAVAMLDQQSGETQGTERRGFPGGTTFGGSEMRAEEGYWYGDRGGASRYFYCAKASKSERDSATHPTVKPVELMRWLVRLVTPPDGLVLDPFAGSGTTGVAATVEGRRCVLVEREPCGGCAGGCPDYAGIIVHRLSKPIEPTLDLGGAA